MYSAYETCRSRLANWYARLDKLLTRHPKVRSWNSGYVCPNSEGTGIVVAFISLTCEEADALLTAAAEIGIIPK